MKTRTKILIAVTAVVFALMAVVATIAIVFAATKQSVTTPINISYTAENVSANVSATMKISGGEEELLGSLTFNASDTQGTGTMSPNGDIVLTSSATYVEFKYTFQNTGDNTFVAVFDYTDTQIGIMLNL